MRTRNEPFVAQALEIQMKKKVLIIGGIAAASLLVGGWALAQTTGPGGFGPPFMRGMGPGGMGPGGMGPGMHGPMGPGMRGQMGPGMRGQMGPGMRGQMGPGMMFGGAGPTFADPAQIETLKKELAITSAQEPAWTKYAKTVQDSAATMQKAREGIDPDAVSKLSPQGRFATMTKMREQGQKQFETVQTAAKELLATLDDTQKAKAQETLPGLAFGPGMMHSAGVGGPRFRR